MNQMQFGAFERMVYDQSLSSSGTKQSVLQDSGAEASQSLLFRFSLPSGALEGIWTHSGVFLLFLFIMLSL